jgi:hypothetical protein
MLDGAERDLSACRDALQASVFERCKDAEAASARCMELEQEVIGLKAHADKLQSSVPFIHQYHSNQCDAVSSPLSLSSENSVGFDLIALRAQYESACLRISQLDHEVFSSKIEITHLQCLLDKVNAFFNVFRSKINTRAEVPSEICSVIDSLDCRSLDSLTICSQKMECVLVTDSVVASTSDLSSRIVDHLHSATCNDCLAFNSSFISSAWASGLGFIRHATNRATSSSLLAPLYTRLDLRTHITDDERSV